MTVTNFYHINETGSKKNQEDFIWPDPQSVDGETKIFIVCDGVGGSSKGEVASRMVAEYMGHALSKMDVSAISIDVINELLSKARNALDEYAKAQNTGSDMATTFTLLVLHAKKAFIAWCGDSRVYHFRDGAVIYKTEDHSLVNSLVKSGEISETEARVHPQRNIILKAIKADSSIIEAEGGWVLDIKDGDYFLLCTDGLLENWNDAELAGLLFNSDKDGTDLLEAIKKKSLNRTRDNYSMYLLKVNAEDVNGKVQNKRKRKINPLVPVVLLAVIITGIVYGVSQRQVSTITQPIVKSKDSIGDVTTAPARTEKPASDTTDKPVMINAVSLRAPDSSKVPADTTLKKKLAADTATKKKLPAKVKTHSQIDSGQVRQQSLPPEKVKKEEADSIHQ